MTLDAMTGQDHYYFEDFVAGDVIRGPGMTISETHLIGWAGLTGDLLSLHLDEEFAAASPFGGRVAAGPMTFALGIGLVTQTGVFRNVRAWLGAEDVRALAPVYLGDTIRAEVVVAEARDVSAADQGIWVLNYTVRNQRGEDVMTFTSKKLMFRRHPREE